ncbi:MAG: hypothetical protein ACTS22_06395 [Phycisphaerales bacterium]
MNTKQRRTHLVAWLMLMPALAAFTVWVVMHRGGSSAAVFDAPPPGVTP